MHEEHEEIEAIPKRTRASAPDRDRRASRILFNFTDPIGLRARGGLIEILLEELHTSVSSSSCPKIDLGTRMRVKVVSNADVTVTKKSIGLYPAETKPTKVCATHLTLISKT
jgi:hypothetical protein